MGQSFAQRRNRLSYPFDCFVYRQEPAVKILESAYLGRLVRLGCIVCRRLIGDQYDPPDPSLQLTVIHHLREGEGGQ